MFTKRSLLVLLVGVNVLLLALLFGTVTTLPTASAQPPGRGGGGGYVCVTAKPSGQSYDVLYMVDLPTRKLHAFYPSSAQNRQMSRAEPRDLDRDFGKKD